MAERRKTRKRKEENNANAKPSKEEYAVAKHVRFNCPTKETIMYGQKVNFFVASKAVDCLMETKWATGKNPIFSNRESVVAYMNNLLYWQCFFHRAHKHVKTVPLKEKRRDKEKKDEGESGIDDSKAKKGNKSEGEKSPKVEKKERKEKRKIKLEMHDHQVFLDGPEVYVWVYDPVSPKTFLMGLLLVLGAIAICMFPLWPSEVRTGVYYTSLAGLAFVGSILGLAVLRAIVFCMVWGATLGRHHLWIFPNLTEDVGFFESFVPLYEHHHKGEEVSETEKKKQKKSKEERKSGNGIDNDDRGKDGAEDEKDRNSAETGSTSGAGSRSRSGSRSEEASGEEFEVIQQDEIEEADEERDTQEAEEERDPQEDEEEAPPTPPPGDKKND